MSYVDSRGWSQAPSAEHVAPKRERLVTIPVGLASAWLESIVSSKFDWQVEC